MSKAQGLYVENRLRKSPQKLVNVGGTKFSCLIMENTGQKLKTCVQMERKNVFFVVIKIEKIHELVI